MSALSVVCSLKQILGLVALVLYCKVVPERAGRVARFSIHSFPMNIEPISDVFIITS